MQLKTPNTGSFLKVFVIRLFSLPVDLGREIVLAHSVIGINLVTPKRRMDLIESRVNWVGKKLGIRRFKSGQRD